MLRLTFHACLTLLIAVGHVRAEPSSDEFFETKIRPLLAENCYACHSAKAENVEAGLYLDHAQGVLQGGDSGAVLVPGDPDASLLMRAVNYQDVEMPPDRKLSARQIDLLRSWIEQGAVWPDEPQVAPKPQRADYDWQELASHWAFQAPQSHDLPTVTETSWPRNGIDLFLLAKLEQAGLQPVPPASPRVLVRRIYFDLIGLPPTLSQVDQFVKAYGHDDGRAVAELIDRLLASPHYGERWGRHWLDVARYSDGFGGFLDSNRNQDAWRYRDWVISAYNQDVPYDQFVRLQIAGDLTGAGEDAIGTGFFALGPYYRSDGGDPDSVAQAKSETLDDRMDTLTRGFLALTVSCARCHDHKFDPIPQLDYYSLAGVFNNTDVRLFPLGPPEQVRRYDEHLAAIKQQEERVKQLRQQAQKEKRDLTADEKSQVEVGNQQIAELKATLPAKYPTAHALVDTGTSDMHVALRGNPRKPGQLAPRRFLKILASSAKNRWDHGSGRIQLSEEISSSRNPLTARVIVNRIWMHHFGRGLVRSPSNFGILGEPPTHPMLLDWLALRLIDSEWSIKSLHRLMMNSAAYQMSSRVDPANFSSDGDNRLVWRMNPRRMDVEVWRDSLLAATRELDLVMNGPPDENLEQSRRRTVYAKVSRNGDVFESDRFLRLFDFPLMRATVAQRPSSIVPQQYLFMLNSHFMRERAVAFAERIRKQARDDYQSIRLAYQWLYGREPSAAELKLGVTFIRGEMQPNEELPRLVQYAQILLSANEFMFVR